MLERLEGVPGKSGSGTRLRQSIGDTTGDDDDDNISTREELKL